MASGKALKSEGRRPSFPADTLCPLINILPERKRGGSGGVATENSTPTSIKQVKHSCCFSTTFIPHWKHNHCQSRLMETLKGREDRKALIEFSSALQLCEMTPEHRRSAPPGVRGQRGREKAAQQDAYAGHTPAAGRNCIL